MKKKLFKKVALKVTPFALAAIPGAGAVAKMIDAYKLNIQSQEMMQEALITHYQCNAVNEYANDVFDFVNAYTTGDNEIVKNAYDKVNGFFNSDIYQAKLAMLGPEAKTAIQNELTNINKNALEETAKQFGYKNGEEVNQVLNEITHGNINKQLFNNNSTEIMQNKDVFNGYMSNLRSEVIKAKETFQDSDYITNLRDSIPTIGEYSEITQQADACWNWGVTMGAVALSVGCISKMILDKKYNKLVKENEKLL